MGASAVAGMVQGGHSKLFKYLPLPLGKYRNMKKILLDTNVLMALGSLKLDIFSEIERICDFRHSIVTLDSNVRELELIRERQPGKHGRHAKLALDILRHKKVRVVKSGKMPADNGIIELGEMEPKGLVVATQDAALKKELKARGIPVISIRQKKYLVMG